MLDPVDAAEIVQQEASRWGLWYDTTEDRQQDGWVILLEYRPTQPALARTILRRRLRNRDRDTRARKRGAGFATGRLDAGWEDEIGFCPEAQLVDNITKKQLIAALDFHTAGSRQAAHQAITRAKTRWTRLRRPFDPPQPPNPPTP